MAKGKKICKGCGSGNGCRTKNCSNCGESFNLESIKYISKKNVQVVEFIDEGCDTETVGL